MRNDAGKIHFSPMFATVSNFNYHYDNNDNIFVNVITYSGFSNFKNVKYFNVEAFK